MADSRKTYTSSIDRLRALPDVFSGSDVTILFGWSSQRASTYIANWKRAGHVISLGGRSDVHMNLIKSPEPKYEKALGRVYPLATIVGVDVLRDAGWTTQIPSSIDVAIPAETSLFSVSGFSMTRRNGAWFERVKPGVLDAADGVRRLKAPWALADMIHRAQDRRVKDIWLLDPEDIDLEAAAHDPEAGVALAAFGLDEGVITPEGYAAVYDALQGRRF